jgi:hypothetical protein
MPDEKLRSMEPMAPYSGKRDWITHSVLFSEQDIDMYNRIRLIVEL